MGVRVVMRGGLLLKAVVGNMGVPFKIYKGSKVCMGVPGVIVLVPGMGVFTMGEAVDIGVVVEMIKSKVGISGKGVAGADPLKITDTTANPINRITMIIAPAMRIPTLRRFMTVIVPSAHFGIH